MHPVVAPTTGHQSPPPPAVSPSPSTQPAVSARPGANRQPPRPATAAQLTQTQFPAASAPLCQHTVFPRGTPGPALQRKGEIQKLVNLLVHIILFRFRCFQQRELSRGLYSFKAAPETKAEGPFLPGPGVRVRATLQTAAIPLRP